MKAKEKSIEVGYWVALSLPEGIAPLRSYVGQVQAIDEHGIRLTLVDWFIGTAQDYDLFVAWDNIQAALIATPEHDVKGFGERAGKWQTSVNQQRAQQMLAPDAVPASDTAQ